MKTDAPLLPTHTPELFEAAVTRAVRALAAGGIVALPTETVYGLAANAFDAAAVRRVFEAKGRPAANPIIVHVASVAMARRCVRDWPPLAEALAAAFWPGPLTLVLPKSPAIPDVVTAGGATVGVRWPGHPLIQAVIQRCGFPLAAPSANPSGGVSPTRAAHVQRDLGPRAALIVDGGPSPVGIESTVLDLSVQPPRILRPGMIHAESLAAVTGPLAEGGAGRGGVLKSPGLLARHYAPKARLVVLSWQEESDLLRQLGKLGAAAARCHVLAHSRIPAPAGWGRVCVIPHDPPAFARALYAELRRCDDEGAQLIVVESLPEGIEWQALADRLRRAAS